MTLRFPRRQHELARAVWATLTGTLSRLRRRRAADPADNVAYNRQLWDWYAEKWKRDTNFRRGQADVPEPVSGDETRFSMLGNEWGTADDLERIIDRFIEPYIDARSTVGEIGSGGGRVASRVAGRVAHLHCFDISRKMLQRAAEALEGHSHVNFVLLDGPRLPPAMAGRFDFLYAFDVFVHLDLHTIWRYLNEVAAALRPGGHAFLHTTNLTAPGGWKSFAGQDRYRPETHYFVSPEIIRTLVSHTDLRLVDESTPDTESFYLNRDYLFVVQKPRQQRTAGE